MKEFLIVGCSCLIVLFICQRITSVLASQAKTRYQKYSDQITFVYQQITELYRPLLSLLQECHQVEANFSASDEGASSSRREPRS